MADKIYCAACGFTVKGPKGAIWIKGRPYCESHIPNGTGEVPDVELISARELVTELEYELFRKSFMKEAGHYAFPAILQEALLNKFRDTIDKTRAYQREVDIEKLRKVYNRFYEAGGASMALEKAAEAIGGEDAEKKAD